MELVYLDQYGLRGQNFYFTNAERYNITKNELVAIGIDNNRVQVDKRIIKALHAVNDELKQLGYELFVKDGYRSKELYDLAYRKRLEKYRDDSVNRLMNMDQKPHETGLSVDVGLYDPTKDHEIMTRRKQDGPESLLFDFYRNKPDDESQRLQKLQDLLKDTMLKCGFQTGIKNEYFHFNYIEN